MRTKKKGIILLLGLFTVLMTMLFGVGATSASAQELCTHNYVGTTHIATCTEQGYTEYVCSECGDTYKDDFVEPYGHTYTEVVVEPTCTTQGFTTHYCVDCGYQYSDNYIPAKGHNYSETVFEPTCTEYGYTLHTCTECKASYKDNIVERLGHDYAEDVKEATCLEGGYTTFTCSRCGDSYVGNETEAKGHTYVDNVVGVTCTSYGFTEHICSECNDRYVDSYVAPAGHKYVDVVVPATETQIGYTKHTCEVCGYVYLSDFSESKDDGYVEVPDVEQPPVHEHSYTVEATIDRINRKVNITAVCDCGENGNDNVSVVFVNDSGESTTVLPVDGVADYSFLADENYDVSIIDEKGNVLKVFLLTGDGETTEPEQPENPDETEEPDEPENPDEVPSEHKHEFLLFSELNEADKEYLLYYSCECGERDESSLKVVFVNDAGQASEFTPDADGKICYGELADGHYVVQVENGEEIINLFELSIATEEPEEPENPDQTEQPEEPEQPDNSETPDDNNDGDKNEEQPEEKGSLGLILGAVIFVLVVAGGIVTVVILKKKNKKN